LKLKLILITVLAFGSLAHAQGILSNISIAAGGEGVFPSATVDRASYIAGNGFSPAAQSTTNSIGGVVDARYDFGRHSAVGAAVSFNRSAEVFFAPDSGALSRIHSNNIEIIGTYIFRLPSNERVKPYAMFGGGMVRFAPVSGYQANGIPQTEMKPAFAYGFGSDFKLTDHFSLRLQYRGLLRADPDFKLYVSPAAATASNGSAGFGTSLRSHVPEPSIQIVYHF
jgi:opacity protein-like surface antigen